MRCGDTGFGSWRGHELPGAAGAAGAGEEPWAHTSFCSWLGRLAWLLLKGLVFKELLLKGPCAHCQGVWKGSEMAVVTLS